MIRIETKGLKELHRYVEQVPEVAAKTSVVAVNSTTRFGFAEASRGIRSQVNLSRDYIGSPSNGNRLKITQKAKPGSPVAVITGRKRATSLARYADRKSFSRRAGVRVQVKRGGSSKMIRKGFLIKLKKGKSRTEDEYNVGLALRLKPGEKVKNKQSMRSFGAADPNLYLLYAPSVDQVFKDVAVKIEPKVSSYLQREWLRQFERLSRG